MRQKCVLLIILFGFLSSTVSSHVIIYPGTTFYANNLVLTFRDEVNLSYFEVGDTYFRLNNTNLSISSTHQITINVSQFTDNEPSKGDSTLRFNATYDTGSVTFSFSGNQSYGASHDVYVDDTRVLQNQRDNFSFVVGGWSTKEIDIEFVGYVPDPPYDVLGDNSSWHRSGRVNMSWHSGNFSNRDVVFARNDTFPTSPTNDANSWRVGNYSVNDSNYHNESITTTRYYTVWSWNSTSNTYSTTGLNLPWGAVHIWVFNETTPTDQIINWGIHISDEIGDSSYENEHVIGTAYYDIGTIPNGTNTLFIINSTDYRDSTYYKDITFNTYHNFTFYLAPVIAHQQQSDPPTVNETQLYLLQIINENNEPVQGAKVVMRRYINSSDSWREVRSGLTDGYGQVTFWLRVGEHYKVNITHEDYQNLIGQDYITNDQIFTKTFQLQHIEPDVTPPEVISEEIIFEGYRDGGTLYVNFTDNMEQTINTTIYVYETNTVTGETVVFGTNTTTGIYDFQVLFDNINNSRSYQVVLHINHTNWAYQKHTFNIAPDIETFTTQTVGDTLFSQVYGYNPFGWTNTFMWIILLASFFSFGQRGVGIGLVFTGGILLFVNSFVGFNTTLAVAAGGVIPILFVIIGIMVLWKQARKEGTG